MRDKVKARFKIKIKVKVIKSIYIKNDNNITLMPSVSIKDISGILVL